MLCGGMVQTDASSLQVVGVSHCRPLRQLLQVVCWHPWTIKLVCDCEIKLMFEELGWNLHLSEFTKTVMHRRPEAELTHFLSMIA